MEIFSSTRGIMLSTMLFMVFALTTVAVFAQPDWSVNPNDYKHSTTVHAVVIVDGEEMAGGTLGAFINGECRGVISMVDDGNWYTRDIFSFDVYSNEKRGETIYFMFYGGDGSGSGDDDDDKGVNAEMLYAITETGKFDSKKTIGSLWFPIKLHTYLDTEAPTVSSCPAEITVDNGAGTCGAGVDYKEPLFQDNSLGTGLSGELTAGFVSGSEFPVGTTTVTYAYTDASGNGPAICSFDVTVNDNEAPVPDAVSLADITGECAVNALTAPTATDICDGSVSGTHDATLPITTQGTTVVTWTYTDAAGNASTQTQKVIIDVVTDPVPNVDPLADITAQCEVTELTAPTATFNCTGTVTGTHNATLPITDQGTTIVTWTYDDGNGNTVTQNQNVVIEDTENPTITAPPNVTINVDAGTCSATNADLGTPTTSDNCMVAGVSNNATAPFPLGQTTVTWTVTDIHGLTSQATQLVTVVDNEAPTVLHCPVNIEVENDAGEYGAVVTYKAPVFADNCDRTGRAGIRTEGLASGATFPVGTTTVTYAYTDEAGNGPAICSFTVTVINMNTAPIVANPLPDLYEDEGFVTHSIGLAGVFSDPEDDALTYTASSSDPGVVSVEVVRTTVVVTEKGLGASTITVTARDGGGLHASTDFMFTVRNVNDAPVVVHAIPDQELVENIGAVTFDLDTVFFDKDLDALNYEVVLSNPAIVSHILSGAELTLNALETGSAEVTVRAKDAALSVVNIFNVTVEEEVLLIVKHEGRRMQHQDYVVVCNDAGSEQVEVVSRVNWDLRKVEAIAWLVVNIEQDSLINIAFSQNFTDADRVGEIEVYDEQGHSFTFYVKQKESCYPVGIETAFFQGLWMYPNPVEQVLFITHEQELLKDVRLEIIDGNGKILYQQEIRSSDVGRTIEVDMHGYNDGVYYIRFSAEEQFFMHKIIKL